MLKPQTSQYAVAFIDFLGVRRMMAADADGHNLIIFQAACDAAIRMCREVLDSDEEQISLKMFSDNILLCRKVRSGDSVRALQRVAMAASMFQYFILETMGALVRGGITVGELYIDDMMVWGSSLVTAYKLESEAALYPRIILDPELPAQYAEALSSDESVARGEDGLYYLDYINSVWKFHNADNPDELLTRFHEQNLEVMKAHLDDEVVRKKRQWQEHYLDHIWVKWLSNEPTLPDVKGAPRPKAEL